MLREDFAATLEDRGVEYKLHASNDEEIEICCPFCTDQGTTQDTRFRLGINVGEGKAGCFNCGWTSRTGTIEKILEALGIEYVKRIDKVRKEVSKKKRKKVQLPEDFQLIRTSGKRSDWHEVAYQYLKKRGLSDEQITERKIGFSMVGMFRYRVVIPVFYKGKLRGLVGRTFVKDLEPPYLNSIGEKVLYRAGGMGKGHTAILVEGAFDGLAIADAVKKWEEVDTYAILGTSLTELQWEQLERYDRIISWLDADDAGVRATNKLGKEMKRRGKQYRFVPVRIGEPDPGEYGKRSILKRFRSSRRWTEDEGLKLRLMMMPEE